MSHTICHRSAKSKSVLIDLDLHHSGGQDYGSVSIWKQNKDGFWQHQKRIDVHSEDEGYNIFYEMIEKYKAKEEMSDA